MCIFYMTSFIKYVVLESHPGCSSFIWLLCNIPLNDYAQFICSRYYSWIFGSVYNLELLEIVLIWTLWYMSF